MAQKCRNGETATSERSTYNKPCMFRSYTEFVEQLSTLQPEFKWLARYLKYPGGNSGKLSTTLFVADNEDGRMIEKSIPIEDLANCSSLVTTRVVMLIYRYPWSITRALLDQVCFALNMPPHLLWQHLALDGYLGEINLAEDPKEISTPAIPPIATPSQPTPFRLGRHPGMQITCTILEPSEHRQCRVVYMMLRDRDLEDLSLYEPHFAIPGPKDVQNLHKHCIPSNYQVSDNVKEHILAMDEGAVISADQNPYEFAVIFGKIFLHHYQRRITRYQGFISEYKSQNMEETNDELRSARGFARDMQETVDEVSSFFSSWEESKSPIIVRLIKDLEAFSRRIQRLVEHMASLNNDNSNEIMYNASERSIREADSVKRLSQLAYIYLPLTLSSSIFGMNVPELESSRFSTFVITSVVAIFTSLALLWLLAKATRLRHDPERRWIVGKVMRFAWREPVLTFWLLLFSCTHGKRTVKEVLSELRLFGFTDHDGREHTVESRFEIIRPAATQWERFWLGKIETIARVTDYGEWVLL